MTALTDSYGVRPSALKIWSSGGKTCIRRRSSARSEEHTSELQSHSDLVCRLLLEKKKKEKRTKEKTKKEKKTKKNRYKHVKMIIRNNQGVTSHKEMVGRAQRDEYRQSRRVVRRRE